MNNCIFCTSSSVKLVKKLIPQTKGEEFRFYVKCNTCHARGSLQRLESLAISKWNIEPEIKDEGLFK